MLEPIRLHVDAKRYLCSVYAGYRDSLSPASQHSLNLQGGIYDALAAERFLTRPFSLDAIRLRRWDDCAKNAGQAIPGVRDFEPVLRAVERWRVEDSPLHA